MFGRQSDEGLRLSNTLNYEKRKDDEEQIYYNLCSNSTDDGSYKCDLSAQSHKLADQSRRRDSRPYGVDRG